MAKRLIIIFIILVIGLTSGSLYYLKQSIYTPLDSQNTQVVLFKISPQTSTKQLAQQLKTAGFIKSPIAFQFYCYVKKMKLQSGIYQLSSSMTVATIANYIASGKVAEFKVTFPEGWRITQMAERLESRDIISKEKFIKAAEGQEGYLFPDTYTFPSGISAKEIVDLMKNNFKKRTSGTTATPDIVILASIVEREANNKIDRPKVAGVYANRLKIGMRLQADPTIQYALGNWDSITRADYNSVQSPYNTYLNAGLPPGPICNPGLDSLRAAANPEKNDYFYFFNTRDGKTIYSKTLDEHNANLAKY